MRRLNLILTTFFVISLVSSVAMAQTTHFTFTAETGNNATVGVPTSANPNIGGSPLQPGDEIGVFNPAGLCVGAEVWIGANISIAVWADDNQTGVIDGMLVGERMYFRVWRQSSNTEYRNVSVTYSQPEEYFQGDGIYVFNGFYALSALTASIPPTAPTLVSPVDSATGVTTSPTLIWNVSSGAASYSLQVSTNSSFSTTVVDQSGITDISYPVSGLANNTKYYWWVKATNAEGTSDWSNTWSFTTILAAPSAPTLSLPVNGATGISTSPTLIWSTSGGASSYRVQVSTNGDFSTMVIDSSGITATSLMVSGLSINTKYYWRVNAANAGGTSLFSTVWNFTTIVGGPSTPTLASPSDSTTDLETNPTLVWFSVNEAASYRVQISTSSNFETTFVDFSGITDTSLTVSGLRNNTKYYWHVNATNAGGTSNWSSVWSFTTTQLNEPVAVIDTPGFVVAGQPLSFSGAQSYHTRLTHSIILWEWDFNSDGVYDTTGIEVSHTLTNPGYYTVTLRVTDDNTPAKTDTAQMVVHILSTAEVFIPHMIGGQGGLLKVPVMVREISEDQEVTSFRISVNFDPSKLQLLSPAVVFTGGLASTFLDSVNIQPGEIRVSGAGTTPLVGSDTALFYIKFKIPMTIGLGSIIPLEFSEALFNEVPPGPVVIPIDGSVEVTLLGDVTGNSEITPYDASLILQESVGLINLPDPSYPTFVVSVADVSGDEHIGPYDAALILQYSVGIISQFPVQGGELPKVALGKRTINLERLEKKPDGSLCLPVTVDDMSGIVAGRLVISFDPGKLTLMEVTASDLTKDYLFVSNVEEGIVKIAFAGAVSKTGGGKIAELRFSPVDASASDFGKIVLQSVELNEGEFVATIVSSEQTISKIPTSYWLSQNYPNPFNTETTISFDLPEMAKIRLTIYDISGRRIRTYIREYRQGGRYGIVWDGRDGEGRSVASGMYLYRFEALDQGFVEIKRMLLLR